MYQHTSRIYDPNPNQDVITEYPMEPLLPCVDDGDLDLDACRHQ